MPVLRVLLYTALRYVPLCSNSRFYDGAVGHPQPEHETSHGSMSKTQWAVDGPDGTVLEVNGRKFASNDDGAPMMVSNES